MPRILFNDFLGLLGRYLKVLQDFVPEERNIELTPVSGSKLATIINQRLHRRNQNSSHTLFPVLDENDLLPFNFFQTGLNAGKSVCCLFRRLTKTDDLKKLIEVAQNNVALRGILLTWCNIDPIKEPDRFQREAPDKYLPYASGFLVGGDYLLTNRHVVEEKHNLDEFRAVFNYEVNPNRRQTDLELLAGLDKYEFDRDFWITSSNKDLDYVLLKLKPLNGKSASKTFGGVNLAKTLEGEVAPGIEKEMLANDSLLTENLESEVITRIQNKNFIAADPIHMIQHPGGRPKEVVVFNNRLVNVYENFLEYETDAEPGSSGSPLFNTDWQVVGIHQAALLQEKSNEIDENSNEIKIKGYLGIRMDCILADLREQSSSNSELQDFLEKYVDRTAPIKQPQVFILAGRKRNSVLGTTNAELEHKAMKNLRELMITEMGSLAPDVRVDPIPVNLEKPDSEAVNLAIKYINEQRNPEQQGELAIELLVDNSGITSTRNRSIKIYYNAGNERAQKLALSLEKVLKQPEFNISAFPDSHTSTRRLTFCRNVNLPAVVIFVGDLSNQRDRTFLEAIQHNSDEANNLANSFTKAILTALNELKNK